jgi:hypothetical protein
MVLFYAGASLTATTSKKLFSRANSKAVALLVTTYILTLGLFYAPYLSGHRCFYYTDTTFFLEPQAQFLSTALKSGQIPLWNPFNYCGMPQVAVTFPSLFYLPDWLLVLLPFSEGLAVSMISHLTLAATGFYLLVKSFRYNSPGAFAGALIFSLSGYMFCLSSNISLVAGLAWLPISLWALRQLEATRTNFWSLIRASVCTLMLLLSGRPEIIGPSILAILVYCAIGAITRARGLESARNWKNDVKFIDDPLTRQMRAIFLAMSFSLPELIPVAEWLSLSKRATGLEASEVFLYSAHWYDLLSMFFGPSLGDLRLHGAAFRPLVSFANLPAYISCAYVGPVTLSLALWGAFDKTWHWRWYVTFVLILIFVISLGNHTTMVPNLVHVLPITGFVRFPIKLLGFAILLLGVMSAQGISSFSALRVPVRGSSLFWLSILIAGITAQLLSANHQLCFQFNTADKPVALMLQAQLLIGRSLVAGAAWGIATTLLAKLAITKRISKAAGTSFLLLALIGTLLSNAFAFERKGAPADFWELPSFAGNAIKNFQKNERTGQSTRIFALLFERYTVPLGFLSQNQVVATINEFQYDRQVLKQNSNIDFLIPETFGFEGTSRGDYYYTGLHSYLESSQSVDPEISPPSDLPLARFCAITSTNYLVTQKYRKVGKRIPVPLLNDRLFHLLLEDENMNVRIYKVLSSMPKLYISHNWRWIDSHNAVLNGIVSPTSTAINPFALTSLERVPGKDAPACNQNIQSRSIADELKLITNKCNQTRVEVKAQRDGYLVLSDQAYPGWHAYVDSQQKDIFVANGFTRAVAVPPGKHIVEFKYEPESLILGCALASLAGMLTLYLFLMQRKW